MCPTKYNTIVGCKKNQNNFFFIIEPLVRQANPKAHVCNAAENQTYEQPFTYSAVNQVWFSNPIENSFPQNYEKVSFWFDFILSAFNCGKIAAPNMKLPTLRKTISTFYTFFRKKLPHKHAPKDFGTFQPTDLHILLPIQHALMDQLDIKLTKIHSIACT